MRSITAPLFLVFLAAAGCGNNGGRITVSGMVLLDERPLEAGKIIFATQQSGSAGVGAIVNGKFSLDQSSNASGILPGDYTVVVQSWILEPGTVDAKGNFIPGSESRIPLDYMNMEKSKLSAKVEPGKHNEFTFKLSKNGPGGAQK